MEKTIAESQIAPAQKSLPPSQEMQANSSQTDTVKCKAADVTDGFAEFEKWILLRFCRTV